MTIQQLAFFREACRCGSFSKAAAKLFISQQGLSAAISRLEEEFSSKLLDRSSRGVQPTEEGRFLLTQAEIILKADDACKQYFNAKKPCQVLRIASTFGALPEFGEAALNRFSEENPGIRLEIAEFPDKMCDNAVQSGWADAGFSVWPVDTETFDAVRLFTSSMCLLVNRRHPFARKGSVSVTELNGQSMVIPNNSFKPPLLFLERCREVGIEPNIRRRVGEIFTVHRLVLTHPDYIGLTVESVVRSDENPNLVLVPFADFRLDWTVCLIRRKKDACEAAKRLEKSLTEGSGIKDIS